MWLFTDTGFVSAVAHRDDPDLLVVRGRDRASLAPLAERTGAPIVEGAGTDYPVRVIASRDAFGDWVADLVTDVTYDNFKGRVARTRESAFVDALHEVWAVMRRFGERSGRSEA